VGGDRKKQHDRAMEEDERTQHLRAAKADETKLAGTASTSAKATTSAAPHGGAKTMASLLDEEEGHRRDTAAVPTTGGTMDEKTGARTDMLTRE